MFAKIPLNALRAFEAAARLNSFKEASVELSVTPSAISHQVRVLEEWLGVKVFERLSHRIVLTEAGASLAKGVHHFFYNINQELMLYRPQPGLQTITVTATPAFAALWLIPRLERFYEQYPNFDVKVESSNAVVDLLTNAVVDLAIRCSTRTYRDLYHVHLLDEQFAVFAAPGVTLNTDRPKLIDVAWSTPQDAIVHWSDWCQLADCEDWLANSVMRDYEDEHYALQAAVAGQGHILASTVLAADSLSRGLLVPYRPQITLEGPVYSLVCSPGKERLFAVKSFIDWIQHEAWQASRSLIPAL